VHETEDWLTAGQPPVLGDFVPAAVAACPLSSPRGLAVDQDDRLYVAESGANRVLIFDVWSRRLLRKVAFAPMGAAGPRPVDVAAQGSRALVAVQTPASLYRLGARFGPVPWLKERWAELGTPSRLALSTSGRAVLLSDAGSAGARVVPLDAIHHAFATPFASDVEFETEDVLVVARQRGADFLRVDLRKERLGQLLPPLKARGYDGLGIVRLPGAPARIGYWTAQGLRAAVAARVTFRRTGRVVSFQLDSGEYQTRWGRLFLDACVPHGTQVRAGFVTRDEVESDEVLHSALPPPRHHDEVLALRPGTPPMPPEADVLLAPLLPLHERMTGRELPWTPLETEVPFHTFEVPIDAPPGRFLWVVLELTGNTRVTPRVRCLRAEYPAHELLRRLPRTFSRDERTAAFLQRYLAPLEGLLGGLDAWAATRHVLVHPRAAPRELLPWLAGFVGLVLDQRWPEETRRTFIQEAVGLFRLRGTNGALERMVEIATGVKPVILEHFRLRGLDAAISNTVLGGGFRVGGPIGEPGETAVKGTLEDAFSLHAHRFTLLIPAVLSAEELDMVRHLLELHRPAHTLYELCTVDAGMRVGRGLLLEISTVIGRTGGFDTLQASASALGVDRIVGRPEVGTTPGGSRLGQDTRVG
jgi:phage tail-like protein